MLFWGERGGDLRDWHGFFSDRKEGQLGIMEAILVEGIKKMGYKVG